MFGYHPKNVALVGGGWLSFKLKVLAAFGKLLNIGFHVEGLPFGGNFRKN